MSIRIRTLRQEIHLTTGSPTGKREKFYDLATAVTRIHAWEYAVGYPNRGYWVRYFFARLLERHDLYRLDDHALLHALAQALVSGSVRVGVTDRSAPMSSGTKTPTSQGVKADEATTPALTRQPNTSSMAMVASASPAWIRGDPKNFDDAVARLQAAKQRIQDHGYQPKYTDAELEELRDQGQLHDRFIVNVSKGSKKDTDVVGYQRASGRTTAWTTTFDQIEDADLDPELICAKMGMPYDKTSEYTFLIIDRSAVDPGGSSGNTLIPTYTNMQAAGCQEFASEGDDPALIDEVLTPSYSKEYAVISKEFADFCVANGGGSKETYNQHWTRNFSNKKFPPSKEKDKFLLRHKFTTEIGTNSDFAGNGLTKAVRQAGVIGGKPKKHGALETLTIERNPPTIGQRKASGAIRSLTMPPK